MLQRSTSPIFFARHPPASRAHDIARLLDPAYSSHAAVPSTSAYVDRHGDLHDPDYRHFPVAQPKRRASSNTMSPRPRWETFDSDTDDELAVEDFSPARRTSFSSKRPVYAYSSYVPTLVVPHSYDSQDTVLDDTTPADDERPSGVCRILSRTKRELARRRRSLDAASHASSASPSPYYTPTLLTPDTPTTTATAVSEPHEDDDAASLHAPSHHHPLAHTLSHHSECTHRFPRSLSLDTETGYTPTQLEAEREEVWTPTCAQALRRQWQAVSLRIRFGVFRAQRRMKSRLAML